MTDRQCENQCPFGNGNRTIRGAKFIENVENKLEEFEEMKPEVASLRKQMYILHGGLAVLMFILKVF